MSLRERLATTDSRRRYVRTLFATIADRYDLITVLLSCGRDRAWKRRRDRAREKAFEVIGADGAFGSWNGVAVRIVGRASEHFVDPLDQPF